MVNASAALTSVLGVGRGVRGLAGEDDLGVRHRERPRLGDVDGCRMRHHRQVEADERAAVEHLDLAAAAFLRGRAEHLDRQAGLIGHLGECQRRTDRDRRDQVVAAGMAKPR